MTAGSSLLSSSQFDRFSCLPAEYKRSLLDLFLGHENVKKATKELAKYHYSRCIYIYSRNTLVTSLLYTSKSCLTKALQIGW